MELKKEHIKEGKSLMKQMSVDKIYVNESGEFFTSQNLASLSVQGNKAKFAEINASTKETTEKVEQTQKQKIELATKMVAGMRNKKADITNDEISAKLKKANVDEEIISIVLIEKTEK